MSGLPRTQDEVFKRGRHHLDHGTDVMQRHRGGPKCRAQRPREDQIYPFGHLDGIRQGPGKDKVGRLLLGGQHGQQIGGRHAKALGMVRVSLAVEPDKEALTPAAIRFHGHSRLELRILLLAARRVQKEEEEREAGRLVALKIVRADLRERRALVRVEPRPELPEPGHGTKVELRDSPRTREALRRTGITWEEVRAMRSGRSRALCGTRGE